MFNLIRKSCLTKVKPNFGKSLATTVSATSQPKPTELFPNAEKPAEYTLATLRSFPSLEPNSLIPVHNKLLNSPLRRDILWLSVVMELDNRRVGASNPPGRSEHKFSRKKIFKQKGTGRARVGDGNSPIRFRGAYAMAKTAPNDFSTDLPNKVYYLAYRIALSDAYRKGRLFIIGQDLDFDATYKEKLNKENRLRQGDSNNLEICTKESYAISKFINHHKLEKLNLLFIANDYFKVENLRQAILRFPSNKLKVMQKNEVEVRDLLKAHRIYIEKEAFDYFAAKYTKYITL